MKSDLQEGVEHTRNITYVDRFTYMFISIYVFLIF